MADGFSLTLDTAHFNDVLNRARKVAEDLRPPFVSLTNWLQKYNTSQFSLKGSGKYTPLSAKYAERKQKKFGSLPILVLSGALRASVTKPNAPGAVRFIGKQSMILGSKLPYSRAHQFGFSKRNLPARPYLFWDDPRKNAATKIFEEYLTSNLKKELES